jgi:hypothetical protein
VRITGWSRRAPCPTLAASGSTKLELPVKVPYDFMVTLVKDVGGDWDIDYVLEVGLTIDLPVLGCFTIPLTTEGEMKLPTFRDLLFWSCWAAIGLDRFWIVVVRL